MSGRPVSKSVSRLGRAATTSSRSARLTQRRTGVGVAGWVAEPLVDRCQAQRAAQGQEKRERLVVGESAHGFVGDNRAEAVPDHRSSTAAEVLMDAVEGVAADLFVGEVAGDLG